MYMICHPFIFDFFFISPYVHSYWVVQWLFKKRTKPAILVFNKFNQRFPLDENKMHYPCTVQYIQQYIFLMHAPIVFPIILRLNLGQDQFPTD